MKEDLKAFIASNELLKCLDNFYPNGRYRCETKKEILNYYRLRLEGDFETYKTLLSDLEKMFKEEE